VSWTHRYGPGGVSRPDWVRRRLARVLGPTTVYVGLISVIVVVMQGFGVPGSVLEYAGWAIAMHLWFLAVYLVVVSLTPVAVAAHRRWGLAVPVALAAGVAIVDAATIAGHVPHLGWLNYLLCWGLFYQLGIAWQTGLLVGRKPLLLAAGSVSALALLIWLGPYPISMIGVPGQPLQNTTPPSLALVAFGGTQAGIAVALAPALSRALRRPRLQRVVSVANSNVMALYLWHMVPVVVVAVVAYPAGLLPQPEQGSAAWWLARLEWEVVLSLVMLVEMALLWWLRSLFAAPLPSVRVPLTDRWAEPILLIGTAMASYGLAFLSAWGFAPEDGFSWRTALVFAIGLVLVACRPAKAATQAATQANAQADRQRRTDAEG